MLNKLCVFSLAALATTTLSAAAGPSEDLAFTVGEHNHDKQSAWVIERLVTLHASDKCYAKVADAKSGASTAFASDARYIERYAKAITGDDWGQIEAQGANSKQANRAVVDKMITAFAPKFHLTIHLEGDDCDASLKALWIKYPSTAVLALVDYPPKSKTMKIVIDVTSKAKTLTATVSKDGSSLAITAPRDIEASGWSTTIEKALKRVSSKD